MSLAFFAERLKSAESLSAIQFSKSKSWPLNYSLWDFLVPQMVGKNPQGPNFFLPMQFCTALASFCCPRKRAWKMVDNPKVKSLGVVAGFFSPDGMGVKRGKISLWRDVEISLKQKQKEFPNAKVETTSIAELSPFKPLAFKKGDVKKNSFDTCLALKTDYFGLQNGWTAHLTVCGGSGHVFISFGTLGSLQWHWHLTSEGQHWDDIYCIYIMYGCGMYIYSICRYEWLCEIKYVYILLST